LKAQSLDFHSVHKSRGQRMLAIVVFSGMKH
jgi:hypothetical protein